MFKNAMILQRGAWLFAFFMLLNGQEYWQQSLAYSMDIILQPEDALVIGKEDITYTNHSPDTLHEIYLNLYPRAFRKGSVKYQEFTQQFGALSRAGDFIKGRGNVYHEFELKKVTVQQGGREDGTYQIDDTILKILLPRPLLPHDSLNLHIEWTHVNGEMFERAGKIGDQFNMAQWYPKPMVYDTQGWHINPFHAEGEFYGEFATFDVTFDVPENYVIAATGIVTDGDPGWQDVMFDTSLTFSEWVSQYDSIKSEMKADNRRHVTFHAEDVHDFAWVASRDFIYEHGSIDGIDIHVFYNRKNGAKWNTVVLERAVRAVDWLNSRFGRYPYPQVSVTDRLRGGGMEYPMLVMNGRESEGLIVHEIGHIWFYGILGNNEIDEAWLDEGFTSFQTRWYNAHYYPPYGYNFKQFRLSPFREKQWRWVSDLHRAQWNAIRFQLSGLDEPVSRSSYLYDNGQAYRANVYTKASLMLDELKTILGDSLFLDAMQHYYDKWQLKHVNEDRFVKAMEEATRQELDWFFKPWLHDTETLDYAISSWKSEPEGGNWTTTVNVKRVGHRAYPATVQLETKNGMVISQRIPDYKWNYSHELVFNTPARVRQITIDPLSQTMDVDFRNNFSGRMPSEWMLDWTNKDYSPRNKYVVRWFPALDYHPNDGLLPGLSLTRSYAFWEKTKLALQVGLESAQVYGMVDMRRKFKWSRPGIEYYLKAYRYNGHSFGQVFVNQQIPRSYYRSRLSYGLGFSYSESTDSTAAPLFQEGTIAKSFVYSRLSLKSLSLLTRFETAAGNWSDWSFNKWYTRINYSIRKTKLSFQIRGFAGRYWSSDSLPSQEQFNISGANAEERFVYPYTRHPDSFYGIRDLSNQIYTPGDGGIRGLTGLADLLADQIISLNLDIHYTLIDKPLRVRAALFSGIGGVWSGTHRLNSGDFVGAGGIALIFEKSIWERPLYLRIDFPLWLVWDRPGSGADQSYQYLIGFSRPIY